MATKECILSFDTLLIDEGGDGNGLKVRKKVEDQELMHSNTTPHPGQRMGK